MTFPKDQHIVKYFFLATNADIDGATYRDHLRCVCGGGVLLLLLLLLLFIVPLNYLYLENLPCFFEFTLYTAELHI